MRRQILKFWIGSFIATVGINIALAGSLLNLYRLSSNSKPILLMMLIEAAVPLATVRLLPKMMGRLSLKHLFMLAGVAGFIGAATQAWGVSSLDWQILGICFAATAAAIQKPLMIQFAARLSNDEGQRRSINNLVTLIQYFGILIGYVTSGIIIENWGYAWCFILNAICYLLFVSLVLQTKLEQPQSEKQVKDSNSAPQRICNLQKSPNLTEVLLLTGFVWLTGGSINVLEVEFAKKFMAASDLQVSLLFFASALGAITFSLLSEKRALPTNLKFLKFVTLIPAIAIAMYVFVAKITLVMPFLFIYGFAIAYHGYCGMSLVQRFSSEEDLAENSVQLNAITQVTTLLSAAGGVALSSVTNAPQASLVFAGLTVILTALSTYLVKNKSDIKQVGAVS